jgi:ParB-like chromosome segregation protein Spo0J
LDEGGAADAPSSDDLARNLDADVDVPPIDWPRLVTACRRRLHPDAQLAASIAELGFNVPVLVDDAGMLIAGHGCVLAAKALGLEAVPTIRLGHLSEAQARAFRLADNQLALTPAWDESLLATELRDRKQRNLTSA